jgi:hypothetical protein
MDVIRKTMEQHHRHCTRITMILIGDPQDPRVDFPIHQCTLSFFLFAQIPTDRHPDAAAAIIVWSTWARSSQLSRAYRPFMIPMPTIRRACAARRHSIQHP